MPKPDVEVIEGHISSADQKLMKFHYIHEPEEEEADPSDVQTRFSDFLFLVAGNSENGRQKDDRASEEELRPDRHSSE